MSDVEQALQESGLPPEILEIEMTENVAVRQKDGAKPLRQLRAKGVHLALDDFGTGYASLSYLTRLPLSRIKIDRGFVREITHEAGDAAIVRSLIAMAHNLGLAVIAEGVETEAQAAFLLSEGARKRRVSSTASRCLRTSSSNICAPDQSPRHTAARMRRRHSSIRCRRLRPATGLGWQLSS